MHESFRISRIVDCNHVDSRLPRSPEKAATDSVKTVDSNIDQRSLTPLLHTQIMKIRDFLRYMSGAFSLHSVYIMNF
jgi:predicted DNA-binding transcriptional regulator YafY